MKPIDIRYSTSPKDFKQYTTKEIRNEFLMSDLYVEDELTCHYSHVDRMVVLGCMPKDKSICIEESINVYKAFGTQHFLERREMGVFNIGGEGVIEVDGFSYTLAYKDCLYITKGAKKIKFKSTNKQNPAKFYMVSSPAHTTYKTKHLKIKDAKIQEMGSIENANNRVIYQFIHPAVLETCQLSMGLTLLKEGSVWNTMPCHTHERRMEIYTYFELPKEQVVFHLMGEKTETRHVVMKNEEAIISPSWSIHSGCGTSNYSFIWAMAGENQEFEDMDFIETNKIK